MKWKKKNRIIWGCYAVAATVTVAGLFTHPAINITGMLMLACIAGFCMVDR
jgi:hypothetical protein